MERTAESGSAGGRELEDRNREIIRALYRATGRGNWVAAEPYISADLVIRQASGLPFAGEYHGLEGLKSLFATVVATMGIRGVEFEQLTAGGDWVVSLMQLVLEGTPPVKVRLAESFRLRDGKVIEIIPYYFDPAPVVRAAEARRRAPAP